MNYFLYHVIFFVLLANNSVYSLGEKVPFALLKKLVPDNPIILEAGAQFGEDTSWMSEMWQNAVIHAFEPFPDSYALLGDAAKKYANIKTYCLALSDKAGKASFYVAGGASSLLEPTASFNQDYFHADLEHPIIVDVVTLDGWAKENNIQKIDFMWLDMEGNELKALAAGRNILKTVQVIYTEVNLQPFWIGAVQYNELKEFLEKEGFVELWKDIVPSWHGNVVFARAKSNAHKIMQTLSHVISLPSLDMYKVFLEDGTYDAQDWNSFKEKPKSRYYTFKKAFEHVVAHRGKIVVELGTSRSFVHGGHVGCNLSDSSYWMPKNPEHWDWGAGFFTRMAAECLIPFGAQIHTIDISPEHIQRCKVITADFKDNIIYHISPSQEFLKNCNFSGGIDLLYLDTGDMWPIEPTALLQLEEAHIIVERNLIAKNGIILIDDVRNQTPKKFGEQSDLGKSKYALPYLLAHGFEIVEDEYQVILKKNPKTFQ